MTRAESLSALAALRVGPCGEAVSVFDMSAMGGKRSLVVMHGEYPNITRWEGSETDWEDAKRAAKPGGGK